MPSETTHFEHFLIQRPDQQDTIIYKCRLKLLEMTIRKMIHVTIFCSATSTVCFRQPLVMLKREQRCVLVQSYSGSQQQSRACYVISTFGRRSRGEFSWSIGVVGKKLFCCIHSVILAENADVLFLHYVVIMSQPGSNKTVIQCFHHSLTKYK